MKKELLIFVSFIFVTLPGCLQIAPKLTVQQRRVLQMRTFDASYGNVFKAIKTVFQDEGYIIKNQDYKGGMILAQKETSVDGGAGMEILGALVSYNRITGKGFEVSINLEALNKKLVETRMTLQSKTSTSRGGSSGREIVKPEIYKVLYQKIAVEIQRRRARGL